MYLSKEKSQCKSVSEIEPGGQQSVFPSVQPAFPPACLLLYLLSLTGRLQLSPQLLHCTCTVCLSCLLQFFAQISFVCLLVQYTSK
jgi:hypothetical protein